MTSSSMDDGRLGDDKSKIGFVRYLHQETQKRSVHMRNKLTRTQPLTFLHLCEHMKLLIYEETLEAPPYVHLLSTKPGCFQYPIGITTVAASENQTSSHLGMQLLLL